MVRIRAFEDAARSLRYSLAMAQLIEVQVALGEIEAAAGNADALLAELRRGNSLAAAIIGDIRPGNPNIDVVS